MILPRLKKEVIQTSKNPLPRALTMTAGCEQCAQKACKTLELFLPQCTVTLAPNGIITTRMTDRFADDLERYALTVVGGKITIEHSSYLGLRNALATLSLLVSERDGELYIPDAEIEDGPVASFRSILLDVGRGCPPFEQLKSDIVLSAKAKLNHLHLHCVDGGGVALKLECLPEEFRFPTAYSKEQIAEVCEMCRILGLELIPEYDMPGHSEVLLKLLPHLACKTDLCWQTDWTVCPAKPEIYELFDNIVSEMVEWFPDGKYFHIGGDELDFADAPKLNKYCHWTDCEDCKALREREGIADRQEEYYYFMNRLNAIVKKHGRQTIMWSDQLDCTRPAGLDKDIIMQFWRVAWAGRGPYDGCSMVRQLEMGYTVINSFFPYLYCDLKYCMNSEKFKKWHWERLPETEKKSFCELRWFNVPENAPYRSHLLGSEICAWEYGNARIYGHYSYSLPSSMALFADKMWNGDDLDYTPEYRQALTRLVLGAATPEGFDLFAAIGDVQPPLRDEKTLAKNETDVIAPCIPAFVERVTLTDAELEEILATLKDESRYLTGDAYRVKQYQTCVQYVLDERKAQAQ